MYILESHNTYDAPNAINIYKTFSDAQSLRKAWEEIAQEQYPITLKRVTKLQALNYYTTNMIECLRKRRDDPKEDVVKRELPNALCLLFKIEDSTREPSK